MTDDSFAAQAEQPPVEDHFAVIALPARTTLVSLRMVSGLALEADDRDAIVVNSALAVKRPSIHIGDSIALRTGLAVARWRVVGIAREAFSAPTAYVLKTAARRARWSCRHKQFAYRAGQTGCGGAERGEGHAGPEF